MLVRSKYFLFGTLIFYLGVAYFSSGFHNADEHFQLIEFANYKLGMADRQDLAWEFNARIRSGIQPAICYLIFKFLHFFSITDPYILAFALRVVTAFFAVFAIRYIVISSLKQISIERQSLYTIVSFYLWFLPYINVRFSAETWSGLFFLISLAVIQKEDTESPKKTTLIGIIFGLSMVFRFQSSLLVLGAVCWLILVRKMNWKSLIYLISGVLGVLLLNMLPDYWLYGEFSFPMFNYFVVNIVRDVASNYGVSPWYEIVYYIALKPGPIGLFIIAAQIIILVRQPKHLILWASALFVLAHAIIPHKELRFLFPVVNLIPLALALAYEHIVKIKDWKLPNGYSKAALLFLAIYNAAGILVISTNAAGNTKAATMEFILRRYQNEKINLLYPGTLNPYSDWVFPKNTFYQNETVNLINITTVWQNSLLRYKLPGMKNIIAVSQDEMIGKRAEYHLKNLGLIKVHESINPVNRRLIFLYNNDQVNENITLYEFKE